MSLQPKSRMTVEDFVTWAEGRPGRYELVDGEIVAMSPRRVAHARTTYRFQAALERAIGTAGLPCEMFPDGITVRVDALSAYEPDALVRCGDPIDDDAIIVSDPIIVVDILSPITRHIDSGQKLDGYFRVPSIMHYLVVEPKKRMIVHHKRGSEGLIETRIVTSGDPRLTPPGLSLALNDVFAEP